MPLVLVAGSHLRDRLKGSQSDGFLCQEREGIRTFTDIASMSIVVGPLLVIRETSRSRSAQIGREKATYCIHIVGCLYLDETLRGLD